jgi:hypothetical protein
MHPVTEAAFHDELTKIAANLEALKGRVRKGVGSAVSKMRAAGGDVYAPEQRLRLNRFQSNMAKSKHPMARELSQEAGSTEFRLTRD